MKKDEIGMGTIAPPHTTLTHGTSVKNVIFERIVGIMIYLVRIVVYCVVMYVVLCVYVYVVYCYVLIVW